MKVEIWSDIMCPFCYIGKRKFETALDKFEHKDNVEVVWHSFQLAPNLPARSDKDLYTYVAELKGQTRAWSLQVHEGLVASAKSVGLDFQLDQAKMANTFDAHRVIQLAKKYNLTSAIEERFFKAYFSERALMSDHPTLVKLAVEVGLQQDEVTAVLSSNQYAEEARKDGLEAQRLGANGVPFFVINRQFAVAGAQDSQAFSEVIEKAYKEWIKENPAAALERTDGAACTPEGICE